MVYIYSATSSFKGSLLTNYSVFSKVTKPEGVRVLKSVLLMSDQMVARISIPHD
jgi:hypothetical protein